MNVASPTINFERFLRREVLAEIAIGRLSGASTKWTGSSPALRQRGLRPVPLLAQRARARPGWPLVAPDPGHRLRHRGAPLHHRPEPVPVQRRHAAHPGGFHLRAGRGPEPPLRLAAPQTRRSRSAFYRLVGGHPTWCDRGLHEMVARGLDLDALEARADRDEGSSAIHLRRMLVLAGEGSRRCAKRCAASWRAGRCPNAGVVLPPAQRGRMAGDRPLKARPRCGIYASYLKRHLAMKALSRQPAFTSPAARCAHDAPSYVERRADHDLSTVCVKGNSATC